MIALSLWLTLALPAHAGKVRDAEQAVLVDPASVEAWVVLGDLYGRKGRQEDAQAAYRRALALDPGNDAVRSRLSSTGTTREVRQLERQALKSPLDDEVWGDLGDAYAAIGDEAAALRAYMAAFRIDPADGEWHGKIGGLGGAGEILDILSAEAERTTDDERLGDLGDLLRAAGREDEACAVYGRAAAADPSDGEWQARLQECGHASLGDPYGAGIADPGGAWGGVGHTGAAPDRGLTALGRSALASGDRPRALEYYQAALLEDPMDREALTAVMVLTERTLVQVLETLTTRITGSDELWGDLGDAYVAVGQLDKARDAWKRASELDPADSEWQRKRAIIDPGGSPGAEPVGEPLFRLPP